jgi:hypothetical protein
MIFLEKRRMRGIRNAGLVGLLGVIGLAACDLQGRPPVLPETDSLAAWFGEGTETKLNGNVLEIHGTVDTEFFRRGGSLWEKSSPYFYLFNVKIRDIVAQYPDLAAVRAIASDESGDEVGRAMLHTRSLNEYEWRNALALASLAQREGSQNLRHIAALIRFGEEHTEYSYRERD